MAKRTREKSGVDRRYVFRLYPTVEQEAVLRQQARMCTDLWNAMLGMCERRFDAAGQRDTVYWHDARGNQRQRFAGKFRSFHCRTCAEKTAEAGKLALCDDHKLPTEFDMGYMISAMLAQCPEWRALSTWTPRRVATSLAASYQAFFRRAKNGAGGASGYPRYKSRRRDDLSIPHRSVSGCKFVKSDRHPNSWVVRLKGVGNVWARGALPAEVTEWTDVDVMYRDGRWQASAAVVIAPRRETAGMRWPITVRFNLIEGFAEVNGDLQIPDDLMIADRYDRDSATMQSEFDATWPRGRRLTDEEMTIREEDRREISALKARAARIRRNAIHVWSKRIVERSSVLTIIKPDSIKDRTASPRGHDEQWGAAVDVVSGVNRRILSFAPATAVQMLQYKAEETGIPVQLIDDTDPDIVIGEKLVAAGKSMRHAKRAIRRL